MDDFLRINEGIERCASVAADAMLATSPELNREHIRQAMERELWLAVNEVAQLSRSGAVLV